MVVPDVVPAANAGVAPNATTASALADASKRTWLVMISPHSSCSDAIPPPAGIDAGSRCYLTTPRKLSLPAWPGAMAAKVQRKCVTSAGVAARTLPSGCATLSEASAPQLLPPSTETIGWAPSLLSKLTDAGSGLLMTKPVAGCAPPFL